MPWNTIDPGLQAATILGQRTATGVFCTLCQECDHSSDQCDLAPIQQQMQVVPQPPSSSTQPAGTRPPKRPESRLHICINWNKGVCRRDPCTYRHICASCQMMHRARDCPDTPADSEYKAVTPVAFTSARTIPRKNIIIIILFYLSRQTIFA